MHTRNMNERLCV